MFTLHIALALTGVSYLRWYGGQTRPGQDMRLAPNLTLSAGSRRRPAAPRAPGQGRGGARAAAGRAQAPPPTLFGADWRRADAFMDWDSVSGTWRSTTIVSRIFCVKTLSRALSGSAFNVSWSRGKVIRTSSLEDTLNFTQEVLGMKVPRASASRCGLPRRGLWGAAPLRARRLRHHTESIPCGTITSNNI